MISICIITYNRAKYLEELLKNLLKIKKNNFFKIHIFDNASTDSTRQIFLNYKNIFINLNYTRQKRNVGTAKNIISAFNTIKSDFIWIFGDDDRINVKGFKIVKQILINKKKSISGLTLNNNFYKQNNNFKFDSQNSNDLQLLNFDLFSDLSRLGQISCQIFNLKMIKKLNIHKNISPKLTYPHLEIWRRLYNINNNSWKFCNNKIVSILRHELNFTNYNDNKQLEGFNWKNKNNIKNFLSLRLKNDVHEYSNCINKLNLNKVKKDKLYNKVFEKIFRSWIIENLIFNLKIKNTISIFKRNLNFKNAFILKLICISPNFLTKFFVKVKRKLLQNYND